jgi:hypothetical protein
MTCTSALITRHGRICCFAGKYRSTISNVFYAAPHF